MAHKPGKTYKWLHSILFCMFSLIIGFHFWLLQVLKEWQSVHVCPSVWHEYVSSTQCSFSPIFKIFKRTSSIFKSPRQSFAHQFECKQSEPKILDMSCLEKSLCKLGFAWTNGKRSIIWVKSLILTLFPNRDKFLWLLMLEALSHYCTGSWKYKIEFERNFHKIELYPFGIIF